MCIPMFIVNCDIHLILVKVVNGDSLIVLLCCVWLACVVFMLLMLLWFMLVLLLLLLWLFSLFAFHVLVGETGEEACCVPFIGLGRF